MFHSVVSRISIYSQDMKPYIISRTLCRGTNFSSFYDPARSFLVTTLLTHRNPEKRETLFLRTPFHLYSHLPLCFLWQEMR